MPNATVYIRQEDWDTWQTLGNKSQWLSDALNGNAGRIPPKVMVQAIDESMAVQRKMMAEVSLPTAKVPRSPLKMCQHGAAIGFCKHGCKK